MSTDIEYVPPEEPIYASKIGDFRSINIGYGAKSFRADSQGIWLGAAKFTDAPFRVDTDGNMRATSVTLSGYVAVGGAAADVNSGSVTIGGGKITAGSITADRIQTGALVVGTNVGLGTAKDAAGVTTIVGNTVTTSFVNALNITAQYVTASVALSSPTITGGTISIGSGNSIFKADSNGIYLGNASFASAPFRVSMSGAVTASSLTLTNASLGSGCSYTGNQISETYLGNISASKITAGDIDSARMQTNALTALQANVTTLSAITANMGTITAGTIKVSTRLNVQKSDGTAVGYIGSDPDSIGLWGFVANRGYGLMCKYSSSSYFRIFVDSSATDAVIDLPSPDKLKIQANDGSAIARFYGPDSGWLSSVGGLDMFGGLQLYNSSSGLSGCGSSNRGMMFYNTTYNEVWVWRYNGSTYEWKALAWA